MGDGMESQAWCSQLLVNKIINRRHANLNWSLRAHDERQDRDQSEQKSNDIVSDCDGQQLTAMAYELLQSGLPRKHTVELDV